MIFLPKHLHYRDRLIVSLLLCYKLCSASEMQHVLKFQKEKSWCYQQSAICGQQTWGGLCTYGTTQSPINLPAVDSLREDPTVLNFPMDSHILNGFRVENNGLNVEVFPLETQTNLPVFHWPQLNASYRLHSMNFHWGSAGKKGSEHTINKKQFALEAHLLYYRTDFSSIESALNAKDIANAVGIIGLLFNESPQTQVPPKEGTILGPVAKQLQKIKTPSDTITTEEFDLRRLFVGNSVYSYLGSLAVPDCSENVGYLIWATPANASHTTMKALRSLINPKGHHIAENYRNVNPVKDHKVQLIRVKY